MDVDSALDVETGEDGLHLEHAVRVGRPHTAQEGRFVGVQISLADGEVGDIQLREELHEGRVGREAGEAGVAAYSANSHG